MKLTRNQIGIIAAIIIAIVALWGGCKIGQRSCPATVTKEVIRYVPKIDTVLITEAGEVKYLKGKEVIIIKTDKQKDSLLAVQSVKIQNTEKLLDYYRGQYEAIAEAGVGDVIASEPPYVDISGEGKSKNDSTLIVRWSVTVAEGAMPDGTPQNPNPRFEVISTEKQTVQTVDASKPYALGAGIGAKLGLDGKGLDAVPMLHLRTNATVWFGRYHVRAKAVEVGLAKEFQWGKKK